MAIIIIIVIIIHNTFRIDLIVFKSREKSNNGTGIVFRIFGNTPFYKFETVFGRTFVDAAK